MVQFLYPSIFVAAVGLTLIFVKFWFIRRVKRRINSSKFEAADERTSWTPMRNRIIELCITLCAIFVSVYSTYGLQRYQTLIDENAQSTAICFTAQNGVGYFDAFLSSFGMDSADNFKRVLPIDTSILKYFVREYSNGYKPFYVIDRFQQDQLEYYLKPIPYSTILWLESNEKSALKTAFNKRISLEFRVKALYASYQFDSLRQYTLYSELLYLIGQIDPESFAARLRAINLANGKLIDMLNPAFQSEVPFRFPTY